ncbi:MAG: hypothetical protein WKF59_13235 [Chitinophagaceae bacterium]
MEKRKRGQQATFKLQHQIDTDGIYLLRKQKIIIGDDETAEAAQSEGESSGR